MSRIILPAVAGTLLYATVAAGQQPGDREAMIRSAMSAAPAAISAHATIMNWDQTVLREGDSRWTCFPDNPNTEGQDPMCLDESWLALVDAWVNRAEPTIANVGIAYMLRGDSGASLSDPFATGPDDADDWYVTDSHLMIAVPDPAMLEGLPTDPAGGGPYVMWAGTPYAHIMAPVPGGDR